MLSLFPQEERESVECTPPSLPSAETNYCRSTFRTTECIFDLFWHSWCRFRFKGCQKHRRVRETFHQSTDDDRTMAALISQWSAVFHSSAGLEPLLTIDYNRKATVHIFSRWKIQNDWFQCKPYHAVEIRFNTAAPNCKESIKHNGKLQNLSNQCSWTFCFVIVFWT